MTQPWPIPSPDGTHHLRGDTSAYDERFDAVLKFHAPGLAPVRRLDMAWHIHPDGAPAYARRFRQAFGFYEGRAAVVDADGWLHIHPDGTDAGVERHAWCGNYQDGRCAVRARDGRYHHLTPDGRPAYLARWRYAGDYRDGVAVVQADDGRSIHIDRDGHQLHGRWFLDLDVFHKGFARARDDAGWTHVDRAGRSLYRRRFAAVEPFYNGQARVERFDGGLEIIAEGGEPLVELRPALRSDLAALSADLVGFWRTETIGAAVELGVFEALPATAVGLARRRRLHLDRARRLLRALAELGLVAAEDDHWHLTDRGALLTLDHPQTLADAAIEYRRPLALHWRALPDALRLDADWRPPAIFAEVAAEPARIIPHHRMLRSYARHDYRAVPAALGLAGHERIIDAGGGTGALAHALLDHHRGLRVAVLDRPEVVAAIPPRARLDAIAADLFAPWPAAADAVVLARVLHDWDDAAAIELLRHAAGALPPGGRLFAVEMVLSPDAAAGALCDLHLLLVSGGRERTAAQYAALFAAAGFDFEALRDLPALVSVMVAVKRESDP